MSTPNSTGRVLDSSAVFSTTPALSPQSSTSMSSRVLGGKSRTMVIVATNAYEKIREDIRRRLSKVSLNDGVTRDMLLAVVNDSLKREGWVNLKADDLLDMMEREVTIRRRASLTPSDVQEIFREVRKSKEAPLRERIRESMTG